MVMTHISDNRPLIPQDDYSPVVRERINRLIREADHLFSLGDIRERCQQVLIASLDGKLPSPFAEWSAQLYVNREFRFALSLSLSYKSTMDEIVQWAKGCIDEYLLVEIQEERARWIEEFARIKFASRWYQMKNDDVAWRVFSKNVPYGEAGKEEEIKQFFDILDRICILTDVLTGHAEEYGLKVDYSKLQQKKKNEGQVSPDLVTRLKSIFYNNEENVKLFLKEISGMQPNDITDLVNRWVKEKRISDYGNSRKGMLWEILTAAGLYTKSRQNWCRRVY